MRNTKSEVEDKEDNGIPELTLPQFLFFISFQGSVREVTAGNRR